MNLRAFNVVDPLGLGTCSPLPIPSCEGQTQRRRDREWDLAQGTRYQRRFAGYMLKVRERPLTQNEELASGKSLAVIVSSRPPPLQAGGPLEHLLY